MIRVEETLSDGTYHLTELPRGSGPGRLVTVRGEFREELRIECVPIPYP